MAPSSMMSENLTFSEDIQNNKKPLRSHAQSGGNQTF